MPFRPVPLLRLILAVTTLAPLLSPLAARQTLALSGNWRFQRGDHPQATAADFDDSGWHQVTVPHDWSVEQPPEETAPSAGGGGFFPTGIGWYRQTFHAPRQWRGQRVTVEFEGAYRRTQVWLNGEQVGSHAYGYTPFHVDLTPHLRIDGPNTLVVRIDNSAQPNSRWYSGSGLYRPVTLHVTDPVHVAPHSLWAYVTDRFADVTTIGVDLEVTNRSDTAQSLRVDVTVIDPAGLPIAASETPAEVTAGGTTPVHTKVALPHPQLWSPEHPFLYRAVARVYVGRRLADRAETTLGLRTIEVSAEEGLRLNGKPVELLGANVHHDHGPLGAAAYADAERRKVRLLKAAGFNAVRTAHNPPPRVFLDACDAEGLLVINEAFDGWAKAKLPQDHSIDFPTTWPADIAAFVRRDRSHPSVIMWSIGNEMYERGAASGRELTAALRARIREFDTTRPVTAGVNGLGANREWSDLDPLFSNLDVAGYNYELHRHAEDHARVPRRVIYSAESYSKDVFAGWQAVTQHAHVIGDFVWTGQDYLGESGIGRVFAPDETPVPHWEGDHFPWHGALTGDLDLIGHRRPVSHYRQIVWDRGETLYAAVQVLAPEGRAQNPSAWSPPPLQAHWTWPEQAGRELPVEVYSRHPSVRLYLNERLIGEQPTTVQQEFKATFAVPYEPGELRAVGVRDGREIEEFRLRTAGPAAALRLTADEASLTGNGHDLAFVTVEVVDPDGQVVPTGNQQIHYTLRGPGTLVGIGSADLSSRSSYRENPRAAHEGRALVVVRASEQAGEAVLTATAPGLAPATLRLTITPGHAP